MMLFSQNISKKRSVLFIGNSYTYVNNLPQLVEQLALANGDTLIYDSYAPGGYTFNNHFYDPNCKIKIYSKHWDFVVLQAQSQEPSFSPAQVNAQTLPYAIKLDSLIKDNYTCSKTVFYETWGRKFGDASNCPAYPPVCTYTGMQNRLKQSYTLFANLTSGIVAPAGEAFRASVTQSPSLELYQSDQSHPSLEGSYLIASVFYETLFQRSVLSNTFISTINPATAAFLQQTAHQVLRDSLDIWNIGLNLPWADFSSTSITTNVYQFHSNSGTLNNLWYFGDGSFSSGASLTHTYSTPGIYTVSQVVNDNCYKDSVSHTLLVTLATTLEEDAPENQISLFPNPAVEYLQWASTEMMHLSVYNSSGELVLEETTRNKLNVSGLNAGLYLVRIQSEKGILLTRFVKTDQ